MRSVKFQKRKANIPILWIPLVKIIFVNKAMFCAPIFMNKAVALWQLKARHGFLVMSFYPMILKNYEGY